jgi:hypothetical protein
MKTADWALVISIGSFVIAILGFLWNVWSKFIYPKARVRTTIAVMKSFGGGAKGRELIVLNATNYGPTDVTLYAAISRARRSFLRLKSNTKLAILQPLDNADSDKTSGFFSGGLPKKLLVGEQFAVFFPASAAKKWATEKKLSDYGFSNTFGRYHWCSRGNSKEFAEKASGAARK